MGKLAPLTVLAAALCASSSALATDYYVKYGGSDSKSGTNTGQAWGTLGHICDVSAGVQAGDIVHVSGGGGDYAGFICNGLNGAAGAGNLITIISEPLQGAVIDTSVTGGGSSYHCATFVNSSFIHFEGFTFAGCDGLSAIGLTDSSNMEIVGHAIDGAPTNAGIILNASTNVLIEGCAITGAPIGITIGKDKSGAQSASVAVSANRISLSASHGLVIGDSTTGATAINNLVFRNGGQGIRVTSGAELTAYNNTVYQNTPGDTCLMVMSGGSATSKNNILLNDGNAGAISVGTVDVITSDDNVLTDRFKIGSGWVDDTTWGNGSNPHDISSSLSSSGTEFLDVANDDYRLAPGAAAIGHGIIVAGQTPTVDINGWARPGPKMDIGAFVFVPINDGGLPIIAPDAAMIEPDASAPDVGIPDDASAPDVGIPDDAGVPDVGIPDDAGLPDTGVLEADTGVALPDSGELEADAGALVPDAGALEADTGVVLPDAEIAGLDAAELEDSGVALLADASAPDASVLGVDGALPGRSDAGAELHDLGGCGCSTNAPLATLFAAAALALLPWRRRRG